VKYIKLGIYTLLAFEIPFQCNIVPFSTFFSATLNKSTVYRRLCDLRLTLQAEQAPCGIMQFLFET